MRTLVAWSLLAVAFAGCVSDDTRPADATGLVDDSGLVPEATPVQLDLTRCHEAGSVAAYSRDSGTFGTHVPAPWKLADIRNELGDPHLDALGRPLLGPVTGHWHMAVACDGFGFGYVGAQVMAPPFDIGGADRHMLLSGLSMPDMALRDTFEAETGFRPTETQRSVVEWLAPDTLYAAHDDATKGLYEVWGPVEVLTTKDAHTVRWWTTVPVEVEDPDNEAEHHVVYFDVVYEETVTHRVSHDTTALGCHTENNMHGPQGGLCGTSVAVGYETAAITLRSGSWLNVSVEHAWHH